MANEVKMQDRCVRNRKRSQRRRIFCPEHGSYLESVSQKHPLFADRATQLQARGVDRLTASLLLNEQAAIALTGEWLECFWCKHCQATNWYHVRRIVEDENTGRCRYEVAIAPPELWMRSVGTIDPMGNPSVGEFTRRQSKMLQYSKLKDFRFM
jgi:hypothetical protein